MALKLEKEVENKIRTHANRTYPEECAGALFSRLDSEQRIIVDHMELENADEAEKRERNFEITSEDYMKAEKYADENGLSLAGIYHSHPDNPAVPSSKDLRKALPVFSYVIISVKKGEKAELRSWVLNDQGQFEEETIESIEESQTNS